MGQTLHLGHIRAAKTQTPGLMEAVRTRQPRAGPRLLLLAAYSGLCGELVVLLSQAHSARNVGSLDTLTDSPTLLPPTRTLPVQSCFLRGAPSACGDIGGQKGQEGSSQGA